MSAVEPPLVSIVLLSWNTLAATTTSLAHLRRLDYPHTEIIVVDNGSTDGSKEFLASATDIRYLSLDTNHGYTGGQLAAMDVARGDFLALVNSDAVVAADWLTICMDALLADDTIAAVGGRAFRWDSDDDLYSTAVPFYSYQIVDSRGAYVVTATSGMHGRTVDSISGAGVVIRRSAVADVGYFDPDFFAYYEETDLFARMIRAGYRIWYEPRAHVWHQIAASSRSDPGFYLYQMHRNRAVFAIKNFDRSRAFLWEYCKVGAFNCAKVLLQPADVDARSYIRALWWNARNVRRNLRKRRETRALGQTYTARVGDHELPSDITVVIPCYNYGAYVADAIESVLRQTLKPHRVIVINDGSTDGTLAVLRRYADSVEIVDKENEGLIATKNLGLAMSNTTWTVFLDADDILEPDYLETLYEMGREARATVVYSDVRMFGSIERVEYAGAYSVSRIREGNFIHNSALVQTEWLRLVGGYKQEMAAGYEDWELYLSLTEAGASFAYAESPLLLYRQHPLVSRNRLSKSDALALAELARSLHPALFRRKMTAEWMRQAAGTIAANPELLLFMPVILVGALVGAIVDYVRGIQVRGGMIAHLYLQYKYTRRRQRKDEASAAAALPQPADRE